MMTHGQYTGTCTRRTIPKKYGTFFVLTVTLFMWSLVHPKNSYAIKSVIDQAQDQGASDGMVRETAKLFPDSRALLRARELAIPPAPIAQQALSDYDRKVLEERLYNQVVDRYTADGMDLATLLVSYVGQMRFKVVVSVRTKELPYPKIRQSLERMRRIVEEDVLRATFSGFELAELSSFTVLNRRNGRYYEYPVLYQNLALPYFDGAEEIGPRVKEHQNRPGLPLDRFEAPPARRKFPWGERPWEEQSRGLRVTPSEERPEGALAPKEDPAKRIATQKPQYPAPRALPTGSYTEGDFYGAPPVPKAGPAMPAGGR